MFRLVRATPRQGNIALTVRRRVHRDVPRAGIIFPVECIDIGPAAQPVLPNPQPDSDLPPSQKQPSQKAPPSPAPRSLDPSPQVQPSPEAPSQQASGFKWQGAASRKRILETEKIVDKDTGETLGTAFSVDLSALLSVAALALGLILLINFARKSLPTKLLADAAQIVADAPDIAVLQEDGDALAAHLDALLRVLLPPDVYKDRFLPALARIRAQGDVGNAAMAETCVQLHVALHDTRSIFTFVPRLAQIVGKFLKQSQVAPPAPDSADFLGSNEPPTDDYPPLKA